MAVIIYILKIYLFRVQLGFSETDIAKMKTLVKFIIFHYLEYWFLCQSARNVQYLDLKFYKSIIACQHTTIANAVLKKIVLHTWYLHERYTSFNLFSEFVSNFEKQIIANAILDANPPQVYLKGKPKFKKLPNRKVLATRTELVDFVGSESHFMFDVLNFDKTWLNLSFNEWHLNEGYNEMKDFVNTMLVTNNAAERGIKLTSEYINILTKDHSERENLLQTVEFTRKKMKDDKKCTVQQCYNNDFNM